MIFPIVGVPGGQASSLGQSTAVPPTMAPASSINRSSLPSVVRLHCEANQRTLCGDAGRGGRRFVPKAWRRLPPTFARAQRERRSPRAILRHAARRGPLPCTLANPSLACPTRPIAERRRSVHALECALRRSSAALDAVAIGGGSSGCDSSRLGEGTPGRPSRRGRNGPMFLNVWTTGSPGARSPSVGEITGPAEAAGRWPQRCGSPKGSASGADPKRRHRRIPGSLEQFERRTRGQRLWRSCGRRSLVCTCRRP